MRHWLFITSFLFVAPTLVTAQFRFSPEKPTADQPVSFTYSPQNTPLAKDSTIEGRYVRYGAPTAMQLTRPTTVTLVRQGNDFVGKFPAPQPGVAGTMLFFQNSSQRQRNDLNKGQLYVIPLFDAGGQLVPHAIGGQASVFTRSHFLFEASTRPDPNRVVTLYEQELKQYPDLKPQYWADHLAAIIKQRKPGYGPKVKADIEAYLASRPNPTAAEIAAGVQLYESMGDFPKANVLRERQKKVDPAGSLAQRDRSMQIRNETDWTRKKAAYQAYVKDFPGSPFLPALTVLMTDGYFKNNDLKGMLAFISPLSANQIDPLMLNSMANLLADERRSLPEAEILIRRAADVLKIQPKPTDFTGNWENEKLLRGRQLTTTLARLLAQQGNYDAGFKAYQDVMNIDDIDSSDPITNERYLLCAIRANHAKDALPYTEEAIQIGKATTSLKRTLRDWYAKQPGQTEAKADAYLAELETELRNELRDELRQKLINEPAPAFSMTDLKGRTISSSVLKGKVVVLDFWATWCGPCVASFPAMEQAQAKFQNDPNVRFLFVNTREGGPLQRVHSFMEKHPYPFVVPIDAQQRVANAYKVQGIPTKVVIGPNGRVRYRHVGYSGDSESTVKELAMIVELLKAEN